MTQTKKTNKTGKLPRGYAIASGIDNSIKAEEATYRTFLTPEEDIDPNVVIAPNMGVTPNGELIGKGYTVTDNVTGKWDNTVFYYFIDELGEADWSLYNSIDAAIGAAWFDYEDRL